MPRIRKDTCPNCKTINPDGWDVCWQCQNPAPGAVPCPNSGGRFPFTLKLNREDVKHLLHCLHLAVRHNSTVKGENVDTFWRRQAGLKRRLTEVGN